MKEENVQAKFQGGQGLQDLGTERGTMAGMQHGWEKALSKVGEKGQFT